MKRKLSLLVLCVIVLFQQKAMAQLPEVSTASEPVWYFIQVVGEGSSRENRVFCADTQGNYLYGEVLNKTKEAQLFRFEKSGNNYIIVSKSSNKKVNVGLNGTEEALVLSETGLEFKLDPIATYFYNITATQPAPGGNASKIWAHQANSASSYKIILVTTTYQKELNSQFSFIAYDDMNLEYSTGEESVWYSIHSAKANFNNECVTDVSAFNATQDIKISIDEFDARANQCWKLVQSGSKVNFVNKATGNVIQTQSDVSENSLMYNYTQVAANATSGKGWTLSHIRAGQYSISGVEEDNITRYLNATEEGKNPEIFDNATLINSGFAWKLKKVTSALSIPVINKDSNDYLIYSTNRRIVVEGTLDYTVRTIHGISVSKNTELPVGIYLVTVNGKTTKLLVK